MLTRAQVENARANISPNGLLSTLVQNGVISELDVARTLAAQNSMEFVELENTQVDRKLIDLLDADDARRYQAIPIGMRDGILIIALSDPMAMHNMDGITYKLRREIEFVASGEEGREDREDSLQHGENRWGGRAVGRTQNVTLVVRAVLRGEYWYWK